MSGTASYGGTAAAVTPSILVYSGQSEFNKMLTLSEVNCTESKRLDELQLSFLLASGAAIRTDYLPVVSVNYSLPVMIIVAILLSMLAIVTAFGNLLVGLALFRYRQLRTISNCLIGNLALSDFLLATTVLPLSIANECLGHWTFGPLLCRMWLVMDVLYCTASIWNLCLIAVDRFTATLYPVWYRDQSSARRRIFIYVSLIWTISAAICVPPLLGWNDLDNSYVVETDSNDNSMYKCVLFQTPSYVLYSAAGSFFVPFVVTFVLYVGIFCAMRRLGTRRRNRLKKPKDSGQAERQTLSSSSNGLLVHFNNQNEATTGVAMSSAIRRLVEHVPSDTSTLSAISCTNSENVTAFGIRVDINKSESDDRNVAGERSLFRARGHCESLHEQPEVSLTADNDQMDGTDTKPVSIAVSDSPAPAQATCGEITNTSTINDRSQTSNIAASQQPSLVSQSSSPSRARNRLKHAATLVMARKYGVTFIDQQRHDRSTPTDAALTTSSIDRINDGLVDDVPRRRLTLRPSAVAAAAASAFVVTLRTVSQIRRYEQREMRATVRMAIIIAFFCCMWLGFFVVYVVSSWCPAVICPPVPRPLEAFLFWLGYSNSGVNPILYTIFNDDFRRAFQKIIGCGVRDRQGNGGPGGANSGFDGHRRTSYRSAVL